LIKKFTKDTPVFWFWCMGGIIYIGFATHTLLQLNLIATSSLLLVVTATDVGAYFAGRTIGGPKIAPSISPSKTWAGLTGGAVLAALTMMAIGRFGLSIMQPTTLILCGLEGALMATVAQAGDFFQSWMKRRAGVKDSGGLIPGHGGLFDRVDGLLAVSFLIGLV
jgi:phosphatidate cytidylyltransferase